MRLLLSKLFFVALTVFAAVKSQQTVRNVAYYGDGDVTDKWKTQVMLDLYIPSTANSSAPLPLFVFIHGGAWVSGDKLQYADLAKSFVAQGVACAAINYRLSSGNIPVQHPFHTQDGAAAVAWLSDNAARFGYSAQHIFVGGHSAGAHMSGLLSLDQIYLTRYSERLWREIRGFVGISGIYDLNLFVKDYPDTLYQFIVPAFGSSPEGWEDASPTSKTDYTNAPWLVIHSQGDELVNLAQPEAYIYHLSDRVQAKFEYQQDFNDLHFDILKNPELVNRIVSFISQNS
eukprot:TRINITY_DN2272_c0_g11_i2.p1 TRINITY_DN2272_c0_g11~~TRINITY_DN2272_c0_g11_i2.p1  ORF type:complete len:287 (-),score=68.39 TRINITY_DN2272_c0_g11_i2:213-1073(-)